MEVSENVTLILTTDLQHITQTHLTQKKTPRSHPRSQFNNNTNNVRTH